MALISSSIAKEMVMHDFGTYRFNAGSYDVAVELKKIADDRLAPRITFREDGKEGSTGIGKGSSLAVVPKQWTAQFHPPYELWIFDGTDKIKLYERTTDPRGFKASSSNVVPSLKERAPEELKQLMHSNKNKKQ